LTGLDLLFQPVALGATGDVDECRQPVEGGEPLVVDRAGPNDAGLSDDHRGAHAAFPGGQLAALEGGSAAVRECDGLGAVVGGEDDDRIIGLPHVVDLLENEPMLSSICFMPASLTLQSLPPGSPTIAMYLSDSTVVMCMRAGLYDLGMGGVAKDHAKAASLYRQAAERGHGNAQAALGSLYLNGRGVPQDYVSAHMWLNLAAVQRVRDLGSAPRTIQTAVDGWRGKGWKVRKPSEI
jgi:hypothetical protein